MIAVVKEILGLAVKEVDAYRSVVVGCSAAESECVPECCDLLHEHGLSRTRGQLRQLDSFETEIDTCRRLWRS